MEENSSNRDEIMDSKKLSKYKSHSTFFKNLIHFYVMISFQNSEMKSFHSYYDSLIRLVKFWVISK